jgi:hypothetical protein
MAQTPSQAAVYDGATGIRIDLQSSIGPTRFLADAANYRSQLAARDMPGGLKSLIAQLFTRGAITKCSIMYGRRVDFKIAAHDQAGRMLLVGGRLEHFQKAFGEITGQQVAATWQSSGSRHGRRRSGGVDGNAVLAALGRVVETVADGVQLAAAIRILSDDS